jgi:hypothetical protein
MELKKVVISVTKASYDIFPKGTVARKDKVKKCVIAKPPSYSRPVIIFMFLIHLMYGYLFTPPKAATHY